MLLVLGLMAGIWGMHVLSPPVPSSAPAAMNMALGEQTATHPDQPQPQHSGHSLWQLCVAVLSGLILIIVALVALTLSRAAARSGLVIWDRQRSMLLSRRPGPARFALCVLRT